MKKGCSGYWAEISRDSEAQERRQICPSPTENQSSLLNLGILDSVSLSTSYPLTNAFEEYRSRSGATQPALWKPTWASFLPDRTHRGKHGTILKQYKATLPTSTAAFENNQQLTQHLAHQEALTSRCDVCHRTLGMNLLSNASLCAQSK